MTTTSIKIAFTTRRGQQVIRTFADRAAMIGRLEVLNAIEADTRAIAPTDTGDTRFALNAEADAIRDQIR